MSNVVKCDLCGKEITPRPLFKFSRGLHIKASDALTKTYKIDVCSFCVYEIIKLREEANQ